jgi:glycosyltransferase involved in cell wall biosynthesis
MSESEWTGRPPLVSVILTTRDRPRFFLQALHCFRHSLYSNRELIVVDDGEVYPVAEADVEAEGGRLIRVDPGAPIGEKLNRGLELANGAWCQKMDDDDWYGPGFLPAMMDAIAAHREKVCRPAVAFLMPFLFFDVARWEIRQSLVNNLPGATLVFAREDWEHCRFRPLFQDEDMWFLRDQTRAGTMVLPVRSPGSLDTFLAVRHRALGVDRSHTWTQQVDGRSLETYLQDERPLYQTPERILPEDALGFYRNLRSELPASA